MKHTRKRRRTTPTHAPSGTQSKNHRCSTNHQVVIDADTRLVVVVGRPLPGNRNDCRAWVESGAKAAVGNTTTIADGGYPGTGLVIPHRRRKGEELPAWKQAHNKSHKQVRARVEHAFARMKTWKILRDCRLRGDGVQHAISGIARMHNLMLAG
ncbi:transposase [Streptomyces sp. NPDC001296]